MNTQHGANIDNGLDIIIVFTGAEQSIFKRKIFRSHIFIKSSFAVQCTQQRRILLMKGQKRILELTDFEWRLLVACLNKARSKYIDEDKPIEYVNLLLIKTLNAKLKKARI